MAASLYLDTTAFADLVFGDKKTRTDLSNLLSGSEVVSSQYVREQFKATFLRAVVQVFNNLSDTRNIVEVLRNTDSYKVFNTPGSGVKARKILTTLLETTLNDVDDKLATLERWIEGELLELVNSVAKIRPGSGCCLCEPERPHRDENNVYRFKRMCNKEDPRPCTIENVWKQQTKALDSLSTAAMPKHLAPLKSAASKAYKDYKDARGENCFVHLSDAVIVAESDPNSVILTTNLKALLKSSAKDALLKATVLRIARCEPPKIRKGSAGLAAIVPPYCPHVIAAF